MKREYAGQENPGERTGIMKEIDSTGTLIYFSLKKAFSEMVLTGPLRLYDKAGFTECGRRGSMIIMREGLC